MFGFLKGPCGDAEYRRAYARCCRHLRLAFGNRAAVALSYEAVFAYQIATEALGEPVATGEPTCCRLRGARKLAGAKDESLGRLAAAFGLVLASIKLRDDVRDDRSLSARVGLWLLRRPMKKAHQTFADIDPAAPDRFESIIADHLSLEADPRACSVAEFAEPTAAGFGYVFSLLANSNPRLSAFSAEMTAIGRQLGAAIIAADCAWDWQDDLRRNLPNPVQDSAAAKEAIHQAQRMLGNAGWRWRAAIGDTPSVALRTLRSAITKLDRPRNRVARENVPRNRWWFRTPRPSRAGVCDCGGCDGGGCDGGDCGGCGGDGGCAPGGEGLGSGGGEAAGPCVPRNAGDCYSCCECCDCCDCCYCPCDSGQSADKVRKKALRGGGSFRGRTGNANGNLSPHGLVVIDGRTFPAQTRGETIKGGEMVLVVEDAEFGLIVEAVEKA